MKKQLLQKKLLEIGASTALSRVLGVIREKLMATFVGASFGADAFFTAFKIPNTLRKVFAEGALSAAFIPSLVHTFRSQGKDAASRLMAFSFLMFEGIVLSLCVIAMIKASFIISCIAPGWTPEKVALAVPMLQILMPFIFFISSSALLAGALQAVNHFFIPAFSPVLMNIVFIIGLIICLYFNLSVTMLCYSIIFGGFIQFLAHLIMYFRLGFLLNSVDRQALKPFSQICIKFLLCLPAVSIVEVSLFVDTSFASYLPEGSIALIYYANRFMGIPMGVFAVALSTLLLPHFSRISTYAPKRLSYYLLEATKFVYWVTIPATLIMVFFSKEIFVTIFMSKKFTMMHVMEAKNILIAFLIGLFFLSLNKILLNVYYAFQNMWFPALISMIAAITNGILDYVLVRVYDYGATGLALATVASGILQTTLFIAGLAYYFNFSFYYRPFIIFCLHYTAQLCIVLGAFFGMYQALSSVIQTNCSAMMIDLLFNTMLFWVWAGPLCLLVYAALYYLRRCWPLPCYFLD